MFVIKNEMEVKVFETQLSSVAQFCCGVYSTLVALLKPQSACFFCFLFFANIFGCCCPCLVLFAFLCTEILFGSIHERHEKARFGLECLKICFC